MQDELNLAELSSNPLIGMRFESVPQEFYYHIAWRSRSVQAGSHKTKLRGAGSDFSGFATLLECPDPKRLDLRASLRTVPKQLMVRTFYERSAIKVYAIADVSSSMQYEGKSSKQAILKSIVESIAWSATRQGDAFAMLGCDDEVQNDVELLPTYRSTAAQEAGRKLQLFFSIGRSVTRSASALPMSASKLTSKRALVFLISDFHLPEALIHETYRAYAMHDLVPIVLWDEAEFEDIPSWGIARMREMESGVERSLFMRPALLERIKKHAQDKRKALVKCSQQYGFRMPFFVTNQFDATALTRHLLRF